MSALDNIKTDGKGTGAQKEIVYLKAKKDFPYNVSREVVITRAHPARSMFKGKALVCMSQDGETGRKKHADGSWADEEDNCRECKFTKKIVVDSVEMKCDYGCKIYFEHDDPEKENMIKVPYSAQIYLSEYAKSLVEEGLDTPIVITKMTRIEDPESGFSTYIFEKVRELELTMTELEETAVTDITEKLKVDGNEMSEELAKDVLMSLDSLTGISEARAKQIAASISKDGMVKV